MYNTEDFTIVPTKGYFTIYYHGKFFGTADTMAEAENDIRIAVLLGK